jgi:hypothetical protein
LLLRATGNRSLLIAVFIGIGDVICKARKIGPTDVVVESFRPCSACLRAAKNQSPAPPPTEPFRCR